MSDIYHTIATFEYTADAQILKGKLESQNIFVYLKDEHTLDSDPLISNAIGGVKLQVKEKDKQKALVIYNEVRQYTEDDNGSALVCENCNNKKMIPFHHTKNILFRLFPFFAKRRYICTICNHINKN